MDAIPKTYVAAEPEPVTRYLDWAGYPHSTREDALESNFDNDLKRAIDNVLAGLRLSRRVSNDKPEKAEFLKRFVHEHPDLTRVLLGDRDIT